MTIYDNKEITNLIYDIEEKINIEKCWIEIANIVMENEENFSINLQLIINTICEQNSNIYDDYENLIEHLQNI